MSSNTLKKDLRVLVGVTGASGSIYASRLVQLLADKVQRVYLVTTEAGVKVIQHELPKDDLLRQVIDHKLDSSLKTVIRHFDNQDLFAPCASGSSAPHAVVVVPCSMGTLSRVAVGNSGNLLERSVDVALKQRRQVILCPRETPLNLIHLKNMTAIMEAGAQVIPLMPGFYNHPETINDLVDFCVGRILEQLHLEHDLYDPWNKRLI